MSSRSTPQVSGLPRPAQRCSDQPAAVTIRGPNPCCFLPLESVLNIVQVLYFECWLVGKGCGCGRFRSFFRIFTLSSVGRYSQPGQVPRNQLFLCRHSADIHVSLSAPIEGREGCVLAPPNLSNLVKRNPSRVRLCSLMLSSGFNELWLVPASLTRPSTEQE